MTSAPGTASACFDRTVRLSSRFDSPAPPGLMYHGSHRGWIEVISGVMFSGKSEELIRRVRRAVIARKTIQIFKSHLDDRYQGVYTVSTHDGVTVDAIPINSAREILRHLNPRVDVVAVDEAQFLDDEIVQIASAIADQGIRVVLAGTDLDFRGEPFGAIPRLLAVAEKIDKLHAICVKCGDLASRNQRLVDGLPALYDSPTIMVGGRESYEARCRSCHEVPRVDRDQQRLL